MLGGNDGANTGYTPQSKDGRNWVNSTELGEFHMVINSVRHTNTNSGHHLNIPNSNRSYNNKERDVEGERERGIERDRERELPSDLAGRHNAAVPKYNAA